MGIFSRLPAGSMTQTAPSPRFGLRRICRLAQRSGCEHPHRENRKAKNDSGFSPLPRSEVMKCALLSNSNIESLSRRVDTRHEMFIGEGYGSWIQELANPTSAMWRFGPAAVVLLL